MRIFITGNMGYVGSVLTRYLRKLNPNWELIGYDTGFFSHYLTGCNYTPEQGMSTQYFGDIRDINSSLLSGVDAVVHLAAISNDPIGNEFEKITEDINRKASVKLAKLAIKNKVKNFVFASSCSVYGVTNSGSKKETDITNPLTAYAKSKIGTENDLNNIKLNDMIFTSLRFATACGWSNRLRLDLVLNDFVACAVTSGIINLISDGTSWRPLIDVEDMCKAIYWAIKRKHDNGGQYLVINTGKNSNNYQVKQIADAVAKSLPKTKIQINKDALTDNRSYSVDFSNYEKLAPGFQPTISLNESISRLSNGLLNMKFTDVNFRASDFIRLNSIRKHIKNNRIGSDLKWKSF